MLERAIDLTDPDDASILYTYNYYLSELLLARGDFEASAKLMEQAVDNNPKFCNRLYLGVSYLGQGRMNEAVEVIEKAMARYDEDRFNSLGESVLGHYYLGQAYEGNGQTVKAIEQYEIFLDIWQNADEGLESVEDAKSRLARLKNGT